MASITKIRKIFSTHHDYSKVHLEIFIICGAILTNVLFSYFILRYDPNSIIYYSDAISHLVISREILDSITPGLGQLGLVWPPITHLLLLPFVTNNFLFHSGLAGTVVSTMSTVVTAVLLFRIVRLQFDCALAGILASCLYLINPSVMYMGVVPMMESPFMMFFILSVYYIQTWYYTYATNDTDIWKQYRSIIKSAFAISAATLTGYDGWFLPFALVFILLAILLTSRRKALIYRIRAIMAAAIPYSFAGIFMWTIWNFLVQKDPLYFATGPYSAKVQTSLMPFSNYLYLNPTGLLSIIFDVSKSMYGMPVLILSVVGFSLYLYMYRGRNMLPFTFLLPIMLIIPTLSDFASILLGYQEIFPDKNGGWSNGRYLVFMAPFFAFTSVSIVVFITKRARREILTIPSIIFVIVLWAFTAGTQILNTGKVVALHDADSMIPFLRSDQVALNTGRDLKKLYTEGDILLFTGTQHGQEIMFQSDIPLRNFIDIGSGKYWNTSQANPWVYADYIVLDKSSTQEDRAEPTYHMWRQWQSKIDDLLTRWQSVGDDVLRQSYHVIYENEQYEILKRGGFIAKPVVGSGLKFPIGMAFVGANDLLVLEKNEGNVIRIINGTVLQEPLLHVNISNKGERGLLGIAVANHKENGKTYVFLYYTEYISKWSKNHTIENAQNILNNRLYRYELLNNKLVNPKLLISLPAFPGPNNNGGRVLIGPDDNVYIVIGDVGGHKTQAQNIKGGQAPDGTSGILRITQDGQAVNSILGDNKELMNKYYYAYGIRNSFGMDFDPINENLWDTETGPTYGDEVNLVEPGFNSGWNQVQGIWKTINYTRPGGTTLIPDNLVDFDGKGKYRVPEFIWYKPITPTALKFFSSDKLGKKYENDMFVGDFNNGNIYDFKLNQNRTEFLLSGPLADKVADDVQENKPLVFGAGFGNITDIEVGSDGYLYVLSLKSYSHQNKQFQPPPDTDGVIYKIEPAFALDKNNNNK
jgi:glucose/arabinose dehydrogenase